MKKRLVLVGIVCLMLFGCGMKQPTSSESVPEVRQDEMNGDTQESMEVASERYIKGYTEEGTELDSLNGQKEIFYYRYNMPDIKVSNPQACGAIQSFMENEKESYIEVKGNAYREADTAYRYEQIELEEGFEYSNPASSYYVEYAVTQSDENYISLLKTEQTYFGGAHGNCTYTGTVFDAQNGEIIELQNLLPDIEAANVWLAQYLIEQLAEHEEEFWDDYKETIVYRICYQPDFYVEEDKLVFPFEAYDLASYAVGPQFVSIPLDKLSQLEMIVGDAKQVDYFTKRLQLPEEINGYLVEIPAGEIVCADLDGNGSEEEISFTPGKTEHDTYTLRVNDIEFPIYIDENMIPEYMGLLDLDTMDGKYELAFYSHGPSDDPITLFYRYEEDGICVMGEVETIWDRNGQVFDGNYMLGNGCIYGKMRTYLPLETRWIYASWMLLHDGNSIVREETEYYAFEKNPYGDRQNEFPYRLHNSLVVYENDTRDGAYRIISGENNCITDFLGTDNKNWLHVIISTQDGLMKGWIYVDERNVEIQRDVYENAWDVIENLFAAG